MMKKWKEKGIRYLHMIEQGSEEWLRLRLGIVTASEINIILTPKGKFAKSEKMRTYACEIAAQRETAFIEDSYQSFDMMRGNFQEEVARDLYHDNFEEVHKCGFIIRDFGEYKIGASPDGLVGIIGGIEIKSRLSKFQVKTIINGEVPEEYMNQIQALLLVSDREWFDYVQYSSGLPLFVKRVYPDPERQNLIKEAVAEFEKVVVEIQKEYQERASKLVQTERVEFVYNAEDLITESEV
jgi:hypothetical protein